MMSLQRESLRKQVSKDTLCVTIRAFISYMTQSGPLNFFHRLEYPIYSFIWLFTQNFPHDNSSLVWPKGIPLINPNYHECIHFAGSSLQGFSTGHSTLDFFRSGTSRSFRYRSIFFHIQPHFPNSFPPTQSTFLPLYPSWVLTLLPPYLTPVFAQGSNPKKSLCYLYTMKIFSEDSIPYLRCRESLLQPSGQPLSNVIRIVYHSHYSI